MRQSFDSYIYLICAPLSPHTVLAYGRASLHVLLVVRLPESMDLGKWLLL